MSFKGVFSTFRTFLNLQIFRSFFVHSSHKSYAKHITHNFYNKTRYSNLSLFIHSNIFLISHNSFFLLHSFVQCLNNLIKQRYLYSLQSRHNLHIRGYDVSASSIHYSIKIAKGLITYILMFSFYLRISIIKTNT